MARRKKLSKKEKSSGVIIFRKEGGRNYYLLLNYGKNYWGFCKGGVEKGETKLDAAKREAKEETDIKKLNFIKGFEKRISYSFKKRGSEKILKEAIFYLAEARTKKVKISSEHIGFKWLLYNQAIKKTTFKNAKEVLKKANSFLKNIK